MSPLRSLYLILFLFITLLSYSQLIEHDRLLSFEEESIPGYISGNSSSLTLSTLHFKDGKQSLKWSYEPGGELIIKKDIGFEEKDPTGKDTYFSTFVVWIYNEQPTESTIQFEFLKEREKQCSFPFNINFKGWRAAWVCYERDMQGNPVEGMDEIRIVAPDNEGVLFIDHLLTAAKMDRRHQAADLQVPFVNARTKSIWLNQLKTSLISPDIPLEVTISAKQKEELKIIEKRFKELIYTPGTFSENNMKNIREAYLKYNITYKDGQINGLPVFFARAAEAYERLIPNWNGNMIAQNGMHVRGIFDLMYSVATAYHNTNDKTWKEELRTIFLNLYRHTNDQGIAYGSNLGNITHYGYSFRNLYTSLYLMKEVLAETGELKEAEKTMQWYGTTNEVFINPQIPGMDIDAFNTMTTGRIASILIMGDSPEKVQYIKSFSRWINNGCMLAPGLMGSFKPDGAAFHHCNNYPAYAVGGLSGATNMIYLLSRTSFSVSEMAHSNIKRALETMRFYCNRNHYPLSMSGRHPDGKGQLTPLHFAIMAIAGTPDGKEEIDKEMASAYLRLIAGNESIDLPEYMPRSLNSTEKRMADLFQSLDIQPEDHPQGNMALGYGCVSVQRRDNWSAIARGHSRYLWAAEHYLGANLYGRYLAHGSLQIMKANGDEVVSPTTSGWQQEGFDWGRIPGTTAIHLPVEELKAIVLNVDTFSGFEEMLYSDEAFAGGLSQAGTNGSFAMKLHEHDKYNGSHRAYKSFHFFDDKIICLGSDIENRNDRFRTETTIFQLAVMNEDQKSYWYNYNSENTNYVLDHLNIGYYIPAKYKNKLFHARNFPQLSRKQNTGEETSGDWINLVFNHGKAPKNESYEYVIFPQTNEDRLKKFAKKPTYEVVQQDKQAHIVKDNDSKTISYAIFEPTSQLPLKQVKEADTPCLVMWKEEKETVLLTVCNPDLALYKGEADELLDENGQRVERSIYSRPWIVNESMKTPVNITIYGSWDIENTDKCKIIEQNKLTTTLEFTCQHGASYDIKLKKK